MIPKPLIQGSHIRIISPGLPTLALIPDRACRADRALRNLGFELSYSAHAFSVSDDGITAGSPAQRAADFMDAFEDNSVDAILASDSGLGSRDIIPLLDVTRVAANPKAFIGYCDTVFLHQYLASCANMSSYYGCVFMVHFGEAEGPLPEAVWYFERALKSSKPLICRPVSSRTQDTLEWYVPDSERLSRRRDVPGGWTWLRPGRAEGWLLGGELSLIPGVIRLFDPQLEGAVLFWDMGIGKERPVRSHFEALCKCACLRDLSGMIVGAHPHLAPSEWANVVNDLVQELLPGTTFPVLVNADLSHLFPSWTVPYGENVVIDDSSGVIFPRIA